MHCTTRMLGVISLALGAVSAVMLSLSFATDFWLKTKELMSENNQTIAVYRHFGFWRICTYDREVIVPQGKNITVLTESPQDVPQSPYQCDNIVYFNTDEDDEQTLGSTEPDYSHSATIAFQSIAPMPGISLVLLAIGFIISACGYLRKDIKTIVAAVIYIASGMILALGIIIYISTLNDEMNHVPPAKGDHPPIFAYEYGWSFMFCGTAYVCSQIAAMCQISLYLRRHADVEDMIRLIPGLEHKVEVIMQRDSAGLKDRDLEYVPSTSRAVPRITHGSIGTTI